nr:hypothetical protein CFP56_55977 [Quercus suber]
MTSAATLTDTEPGVRVRDQGGSRVHRRAPSNNRNVKLYRLCMTVMLHHRHRCHCRVTGETCQDDNFDLRVQGRDAGYCRKGAGEMKGRAVSCRRAALEIRFRFLAKSRAGVRRELNARTLKRVSVPAQPCPPIRDANLRCPRQIPLAACTSRKFSVAFFQTPRCFSRLETQQRAIAACEKDHPDVLRHGLNRIWSGAPSSITHFRLSNGSTGCS